MVGDREEPEEKIEKFDEFGQALEGYISLEQARVLAIQHARDNPDFYGGRYEGRDLVWEVVSGDEGEDYYEIRLSYRPAGRFRREPGLEQFTIDKMGSIELRQILDEPRASRRVPTLLLALVGVVIVAAAGGGVLFASGAIGGGDGGGAAGAAVPTPTAQPPAQAAAAVPTSTARPVSAVATAPTSSSGPGVGAADFVQVGSIDPPDGAELIAGTTVFVSVEIKYGLSSRGSGEVALLVQEAEQFHDTFSSVPVREENELVTLEGSFEVPDRPGTEILVHLRGTDGTLLAETRAAEHKIVQQPGSPGPAAGGDNVEVVQLDPPGGTPLEPGTGVEIIARVQYTLSSQPSGFLRLGYVPSDGGFSQIAEQPVVGGSDSVTFRAGLTVPDQPTIVLLVSLAGADGQPILTMEVAGYPRGGVVTGKLEVLDIQPGRGFPLVAGSEVTVQVVAVAELAQGQTPGRVQLLFIDDNSVKTVFADFPADVRGGQIELGGSFRVPNRIETKVFARLIAADGSMVVEVEPAKYPIDQQQAAQPVPVTRQGGELRIALGGDPAPTGGFDYYTRNSRRLLQAISPAFNGLVEQDPQDPYNIVPGLAEKWEISSDGTGWTFTLWPGVRFHDGSSLDVTDVAQVLEYINAKGTRFVRDDLFRMFDGYEVIDDLTIRLFLQQPFAAFLPVLGQGFMNVYPAETMKAALNSVFSTQPEVAIAGTGPFRLQGYFPAERLTYQRFENYFDEGHPLLDSLDMFIVPDGATRVAALQAGQIDLSLEPLTPDEAQTLEVDGRQVLRGPRLQTRTIEFNVLVEPWSDPRVRRAASFAIDRAVIRNKLLNGHGDEGLYVPPWGPWASQSVPYDPERAKALLAEAGFGDGVKITMTVPGLPDRLAVAEIVAEMWSQVGIETDVEVMDFSEWADRLRAGEYSTIIVGFAFAVDDPDLTLRRLYASDGGSNYTGFSSIDFDNILAAQATTADPDERHSKVSSLQSILADLSPSAVL